MSEPVNPNEGRFQDIESVLVQLTNSQKHLLQAQVILTGQQDQSRQLFAKLVEYAEGTEQRLQRLVDNVQDLAEAQKHSDERLDALVAVVDALVRKNGKSGTQAPQ